MWLSKSLNYFLLWFPVLSLVLVLCFLTARRTYRELPYFFVYVLYALVIGVARYGAFYFFRRLYIYVFWVTELGGAVVVALALYEVFLRRLFPRFQKVRLYRNLFTLVAIILFILTIITALQAPDRSKAFAMALRAYDFVRTAVLVFMVALMALMGRRWIRYDFGIALGFAVQAAVALLNAAVRTRLHYQPTSLDVIEVVSFNVSCLIWLITFWKPDKSETLLTTNFDPGMLNQARAWETILKTWLAPGKSKR